MALTPAEKQRRYREKLKQNPMKHAETKKKHLERYHSNKKLVKDMTEREHRAAKRKWKNANKKRQERQKIAQIILNNTPASTPRSGTPVSPRSRGRRQVRKDRSAVYRQNIKLQEENDKLKRKYNKYKKRCQRQKHKSNSSETRDNKYTTLSNAIRDHYFKMKSVRDRLAIRRIFDGDIVRNSKMKLAIVKDCLGIAKLKKQRIAPKQAILAKKIKIFYNRDDISRNTAGKRETVTYKKCKMQKRYLLDTMKNLYNSFKRENPGESCSYSYFAKQRPFYIKPPAVDGRDTCQCKMHTNTEYMLNALYSNKIISESNMTQVIEKTVCATDNRVCMTGSCASCSTKEIIYNTQSQPQMLKWQQWVRRSEFVDKPHGNSKKVIKNVKEIIEGTVEELIDKFKVAMIAMKKHIYNIKMQYKSYRLAIDELKYDEVLIHVDFSENYNGKYAAEIQPHHFGGSRKQVTLHTGVLYLKPLGADKAQVSSFCSVSPNNSHSPPAIWAHLHPVIRRLKASHPLVKTIHIFSDGPATQYRQKLNFYFICTKIFEEYGFDRISWNFFEAGHGKGAADGVGGCLKRTADQKVASGLDIPNAETFFHVLEGCTKIQLFFVTNDDVEEVEQTVPGSIVPLRGTMQVHQVFSETAGELHYRHLSCFCQRGFCNCLSPQKYQPIPRPSSSMSQLSETIDVENLVDKSPETNANEIMREDEVLTNITNIVNNPRKTYYDMIYSPNTSTDDDDEPLSKLQPEKRQETSVPERQEATVSNSDERKLIEKENVHPSKITFGVYVIVKVPSDKDKSYFYLGIAQSDVDEEGDIKIMFLKSVDDTGKKFKLVERDLSYEPYENITEIVRNPKITKKGRREFYEFDVPLNIFEK